MRFSEIVSVANHADGNKLKKVHKLSPSGSTFYNTSVQHKLNSQYYHETTTYTLHRQF